MGALFKAFWQEEDSAAAIEYALITALIALGLVAGATALGKDLSDVFTKLGTTITDAAKLRHHHRRLDACTPRTYGCAASTGPRRRRPRSPRSSSFRWC